MARRGSGRFDDLGAELRPYRATEHVEQQHDTILITQLDQPAEHVFERAGHAHQLAEPQILLAVDRIGRHGIVARSTPAKR